MKKLMVWYSPDYSSVEVTNSASRLVNSNRMDDVLRAMHPDDYGILVAFCSAVTAFAESNGKHNQFALERHLDESHT